MVVSNEVNQPSTSNNVGGEISGDCFLVLELPEDDPLFEKKIRLLRDKDFGQSDRVYFCNTMVPDTTNIVLDALLQRSRIIHLNDVELYFGLMKVDPPEELYSPRNELEALSHILSLVDNCSEDCDWNNANLKVLRDAILIKIHNFGEKNKLETRIVKEACNNEKNLMMWAEGCGIKSKLQIANVEGAGRGAVAAEDLGVGDIALEIPISVIISEHLVYELEMVHILEKIEGISAETMLLLWSMRERHNFDSKYKAYFDSLPEEFNSGLSFSLAAMMALDDTLVSEENFQAKEPSTSNNVGGEINGDCFLVLELPEDDPLFEKKIRLLRDKGFGQSDRVYFCNTMIPDTTNIVLDALLQRARIIHLNDVELYFGLMKVDPPEELYSPRNELEALSYILALVDNCSEECNGNNANLKVLLDVILIKIHNFGEKNKLETRIVKEACNNEKNLMTWAEGCGIKSKLQIANVEGAGRGAVAAEDLGVGDIALEIPISVIISEDLVYESEMVHILEKIEGISAETMLLLWSMRERQNFDSKYKAYFDSLPEEFNTGLSFSLAAMMALDDTLVSEEIFQAKEVCPHILHYGRMDNKTNSLKFPLSRPCKKGEQCYLSYGNLGSSHLLTFYGFLPQELNPYDIIPLDIEADPDCSSEDDHVASDTTSHMVRGTWLSPNHDIFYYGLPSPLLEHLRRAGNPGLQTMTLSQESLENEIRVLGDLHAIFENMMEKLSDTEMEDRENEKWDVKLAIMYKDLQRNIVSSILTDCQSGRKMVEYELKKLHG